MKRPRIIVYDVDSVNPYGREVAAILSEYADVTYFCSRFVEWLPEPLAGRAKRVLAGSRSREALLTHLTLRVFGPMLCAFIALVSGRRLIILWTRDVWDAGVFLVASQFMKDLLMINHNPWQVRQRNSLAGGLERLLKGTVGGTVVHSAQLLHSALADNARSFVVPHPPYTEWVHRFMRDYGDGSSRARRSQTAATVAFVGSMRPDKGVDDFIQILMRMKRRPLRAMFVGWGVISPSEHSALESAGVEVVPPSAEFLSDAEMGERLAEASLVLAPYTNVTQSGSIILALSAGLDVIAYVGGGVQDLLVSTSLIETGDVQRMADTADRYLAAPWRSSAMSCLEMRAACASGWQSLMTSGAHR